jgi:molecular chaperone DnaK
MIEARNMADTLVYTAEKALRDGGDKVPADVKTEVEDKIKAVNEVKDKDDKAAIDSATQALSQAMQKIGSAVYGDGKSTPGAEPTTDAPKEGTVEGEVVSDDKK